MIIRKPYAFLIRNFKLIHFLILALLTYLIYRANLIFTFFNNYVVTRQVVATSSLSIEYVPSLIFLFTFLVIIFSIIIFVLLRQKDKPTTLYLTMILFYIAFMIFAIVARLNIETIQLEGLSPKSSRIIRDISLLMFLVQIGYIILITVRAFGFDIKKFHFGEDINSLKIDVSDNEEVELTTGIDTDKMLRNLKMKREDLKAFFLENKFIIIIILVILLIAIPGVSIYRNSLVKVVYKEGETISLDNFNIKVNNSYLTKYNYKGDKILSNDSTYLIVSFTLSNFDVEKKGIILNNFRLLINEKIYKPITTVYSNFIDLGNGYYSQTINESESKTYIAVFTVSDEYKKNNMKIRYTNNLTYVDREISADYKNIEITPINLDEFVVKDQIKLNETLDFSDSMLKNTNLKMTSYGIKSKYSYESNELTKYITNNAAMVMKLSYDFKIDEDVLFISSFSNFIDKYVSIIYTYKGVEYKINAKDITPLDYKNNDAYIAVSNNVAAASSIKLEIKVRNITYTYVIL